MHKKAALHLAFPVETLGVFVSIWMIAWTIYSFLPNSFLAITGALVLSLGWFAILLFPTYTKKAANFCFQWRWALALLVFCVCVCFRLHGSSIGVYDEVLPTQTVAEETTLFGLPRWIRSDEFGVTTPKFLSQAANEYNLYSRQMSLKPTNMVLDYYSPVWDWTILGKPLSWGFLLFGNEIGLSWYWCGLVLLLFMTALETSLILTQGRRLESLLGAVMITLSPAIQWWIIPHMPIVILYAMALFCIGYYFFTGKGLLAKWGTAVLAMISVVGFALSVFPSFQVPCSYTVIALLAACLRRDRKRIRFVKQDLLRIALPVAAALLILCRFLLMSQEELTLLLNTSYPGRRIVLGGNWHISDLFPNFSSLFLPFKAITYLNNCEVSTSIHFAPFFLLLSPRLFARMKAEKDQNLIVGQTLRWVLLAIAVFMVVGIPAPIAEVTLLRFCNRMNGVYSWAAVLFTVWGFASIAKYADLLSKKEKILWPLGYAVFSLLLMNEDVRFYFSQFNQLGFEIGGMVPLLTASLFAVLLQLALFSKRRLMSIWLALMMLFCGGTVNPIEQGTGAISNHPISAAIQRIVQIEPDSHWFCTDTSFILNNFLLANGARVLDATNFYPDIEKWAILDPENKYTEQTNRYANEEANLTNEQTSIELNWADLIKLNVNPESLKSMNIRYLFSTKDHSELLAGYDIASEYVAGQDGYNIYRLSY